MNRTLLSLVLVPLTASVALAQPAPAPTPAPAPATSPADQAYQRGRAHYDLHEWDQAIAEFKEAYRLRPDAPSLFNIAQSYRLKGDCAEAASFYKTYRRNFPNEKNIARVDQFIVDMEACAKTQPSGTGGTSTTGTGAGTGSTGTGGAGTGSTGTGANGTGATGSTGTTGSGGDGTGAGTPLPAGPADTGGARIPRGYLVGSLVAAGVGVGCVIGGAFAASRARSIESEIEDLPRWDPELDDRGKNADLAAKLLFVGAGAALVTSGVLVFVGISKAERPAQSTSLNVVPNTGGASVVFGRSF